MWHLSDLFKSGTRENYHLTADTAGELARAAKRLHAQVHGKGNQSPHLDLNLHQAELARRYGAKSENQ